MHLHATQFTNIYYLLQTDCGNNKRPNLGIESNRMTRSQHSSQMKEQTFDDKSTSETDDASSKTQVHCCLNEFSVIISMYDHAMQR